MNDRKRTRIPTEFVAGEVEGRGKVRNVSEGGLFVGTRAIPPQGETVRLSLSVPGHQPIEVTGMVWWTTQERSGHPDPGFGLRILDDHDDYRAMVDGLA